MAEHDPYDEEGIALKKNKRQSTDRVVRAQWDSDVRRLMGQRWGRRVAYRFLDEAKVTKPVFHQNNSVMSHLEGRRDLGLFLYDAIERACPETFSLMMKEHHDG